MTLGQFSVQLVGLLWLASAGLLLEVGRVLGPSFHTKATVHWVWRALTWLGAVTMFARGVTLLFPGHLVEVSRISIMAPLGALSVVGVTAALLEWVMRERDPPPWSVRILRLAAVLGSDRAIKRLALALPPAGLDDPAPDDGARRRSHLPVLVGAAIMVAVIALFLALNAPGARV